MFGGDILHWQMFWEQFCIAIHNRADISDTEKLVYLRHSLKFGEAYYLEIVTFWEAICRSHGILEVSLQSPATYSSDPRAEDLRGTQLGGGHWKGTQTPTQHSPAASLGAHGNG